MTEKMFAFIDECGGYGFSESADTTKYIIAAVLIKEDNVDIVNSVLQEIRNSDFRGQEIKSNNIKGNHKRRLRLLSKVLSLPFHLFVLVLDKKNVASDSGITKSKKTFHKFLNQIVYKELRSAYPQLSIYTDETGDNDFAKEFTKYVQTHRKPTTLFDKEEFDVVNSKNVNGVQLADLMAGTLAYVYDERKKDSVPNNIDYLSLLNKKILHIKHYPRKYDESLYQDLKGDDSVDVRIATPVYRRSLAFIRDYENSKDEDVQKQLFVLKYLLFRFANNRLRKYIPTKEIMNALTNSGFSKTSEMAFRNKIIGKLRDNGVIISSSPHGYKLPSTEQEIMDYYQQVRGVVLPMVQRLSRCNDVLKMDSDIDFLEGEELAGLKNVVEALKEVSHR